MGEERRKGRKGRIWLLKCVVTGFMTHSMPSGYGLVVSLLEDI